jgi:hypothetical protein
MKTRVYVETSVISYLAARPSRDPVNAARQLQAQALWAERRIGLAWWCHQPFCKEYLENLMRKIPTPADTMQELWQVKDHTAARFATAAAYFEHLAAAQPKRPAGKIHSTPAKVSRDRQAGALQAH